jgi:hypothetical protein
MSNNDLIYICLAGTVAIAGLLVIALHLFRRRIRRRRLLERTILWQFPMLDPNGRASNGPPVLPLVTGGMSASRRNLLVLADLEYHRQACGPPSTTVLVVLFRQRTKRPEDESRRSRRRGSAT